MEGCELPPLRKMNKGGAHWANYTGPTYHRSVSVGGLPPMHIYVNAHDTIKSTRKGGYAQNTHVTGC